jgi:hypothetical protein
MRQLGDFATWLGLILLVVGVVYYTPMLVDYMSDDSAARTRAAARPPGRISPRRNMAMHHMGFEHRPPSN